jgi:hypothetical protein
MTMSTAATAIMPVAIQSADPLGMNSPPNPFGATVVLKEAWNSPTSSTLLLVLL